MESQHRILSKTEPIASLTLQVMLTVHKQYLSWIFFFVTLAFGFYKVYKFNLPHVTLEIEMFALIILTTLNQIRLYIGIKSNKTERSEFWPVFFFILLSGVCLIILIFFMMLQEYVLLLEFILAAVGALMGLIEFFIALFAFVDFKSLEKSQ